MISGKDQVIRVDGSGRGLWWEFPLACSFQWQAHVWRLPPDLSRRRALRLARALGLSALLPRRVADLTPEERALADLAVALLPRPDVLVWAGLHRYLSAPALARAWRLVRRLQAADGLTVADRPPAERHRWSVKGGGA